MGSISYFLLTYNRPRTFCLSLILIRTVCLIPMLMIEQLVTKLSTFSIVEKGTLNKSENFPFLFSLYLLFIYLLIYFYCSDPLLSA